MSSHIVEQDSASPALLTPYHRTNTKRVPLVPACGGATFLRNVGNHQSRLCNIPGHLNIEHSSLSPHVSFSIIHPHTAFSASKMNIYHFWN